MIKARLLIVDDQTEVRAEIKDRLASMGHESDEASCQDEALQKLHGMQYDCVLLDLEIPVKLEGVARINHGKNLLQRVVAMAGAPPVIVITSHGLEGYQLAVDMMKLGAKTFVAKPFDGGPLEDEIRQILSGNNSKRADQPVSLKQFSGGALVIGASGIELCGILVGGVRSYANIRGVIQCLSSKRDGKYVKATAKQLSENIIGSPNPGSLTAGIKEFREQCTTKFLEQGIDCPGNAVIQTIRGGGYKMSDSIEIRLGKEDELSSLAKEDCDQLMRVFNRKKKLTTSQVRESVTFSPVRVKAALAALEERRKIKNLGGSGGTTTYELVTV